MAAHETLTGGSGVDVLAGGDDDESDSGSDGDGGGNGEDAMQTGQ